MGVVLPLPLLLLMLLLLLLLGLRSPLLSLLLLLGVLGALRDAVLDASSTGLAGAGSAPGVVVVGEWSVSAGGGAAAKRSVCRVAARAVMKKRSCCWGETSA